MKDRQWPVLLLELMVSVLSYSNFTVVLTVVVTVVLHCTEERDLSPATLLSKTGVDWQLSVLAVLADICIQV